MADNDALRTAKVRLRRRLRAHRDRLTEGETRQASMGVCEILRNTPWLNDFQCIAGYASLGNEIDISDWLRELIDEGKQVCLPKVVGPGQLQFCPVQQWTRDVKPGAYGIDEPIGPAIDVEAIQAFLIPGLAFDRQGQRLGFGAGYYDRALPTESVHLIGVCHHWQVQPEPLPAEAHDRPMGYVVTDQGWLDLDRVPSTGSKGGL